MTKPAKGIRFPRIYDWLIRLTTRGRERQYREDLVRLAEIGPGQSLLDVGCGTGEFAITAWQRSLPGGSVTGVDISDEMLREAKRKAVQSESQVALLESDAANLPFERASFDVVTMITALHALDEESREQCLTELARVLRPDGLLLLVDFAGDFSERTAWIARQGAHGKFDLYELEYQLQEYGLELKMRGNLDWMSLGYLKLRKKRSE